MPKERSPCIASIGSAPGQWCVGSDTSCEPRLDLRFDQATRPGVSRTRCGNCPHSAADTLCFTQSRRCRGCCKSDLSAWVLQRGRVALRCYAGPIHGCFAICNLTAPVRSPGAFPLPWQQSGGTLVMCASDILALLPVPDENIIRGLEPTIDTFKSCFTGPYTSFMCPE